MIPLVVERFEHKFGIPQWKRKNPLDELMVTLLAQNTNDANRDRAYGRLRKLFPTWEQVIIADVKEIEEAIRPAGLSKQKSSRMQAILQWINDRFGELTLEPLRDLRDDEVIDMLTQLKGIGVKTVAVTLAFSFDRDLCPVDTHVHRISKRLGWVGEKYSADKTFATLRPLIPEGKAATFHLNLLKFGRSVCTARKPTCSDCPILDICPWENKNLEER